MRPWLPALVLAAVIGCQSPPPPPPTSAPMPQAQTDGVALRVLRGTRQGDGWQVELSLSNGRPWVANGLRSVRRAAVFHPEDMVLIDVDGTRWPAHGADDVTLAGLERNRRRITLRFDGASAPVGLQWGDTPLPWPGATTHSLADDPLQRAADGVTTPEEAAAVVRERVAVVPAWGVRHGPGTVWAQGRGTPVERAELLRALLGDLGWNSRLACGEHQEPLEPITVPPLPIEAGDAPEHAAYDLVPAWCWAQVQRDGGWHDLDLRSHTDTPLPFLWETSKDAASHLWRHELELVALTRTGPQSWQTTSLWRQGITSAALSERTLALDLQPGPERLTAHAWLVGRDDAQGRQAGSVPVDGLERIMLKMRWIDPTGVLSSDEERTIWESAEAQGPQGPIRLGLSTSPGHADVSAPHPFPALASLHGRMGTHPHPAQPNGLPDPADPALLIWQGSVSASHITSHWAQPRPPLAATESGPRAHLGLHLAFLDALGLPHALPEAFSDVAADLVAAEGVDQLHRNEMMRGLGRGYSYAVTATHDLWERHPTRGTWNRWHHGADVHPLPSTSAGDDVWTTVEEVLTNKRRVATRAPAARTP